MTIGLEVPFVIVEPGRELTPESIFENLVEINESYRQAVANATELQNRRLADLGKGIANQSGSPLDGGIGRKLYAILPQVLSRVESYQVGEIDRAAEPIDTVPTGDLFVDTVPTFVSALTIVAKANGQTFIGKINGVELEIGPESVLEDVVEQYHIKLESLIRLPVDRIL